MTNTIELTFWDAEGDEVTLDVPAKWQICESCDGNGRVENPAFANGISGEEFANEWHEEEREAYMRGAYDVRCNACEASGKVRRPDLSALSPDDRKAYEEHMAEEAAYARERAYEIRWGY